MEVISIERSTYEELLTSFKSVITKMKEMASRGNDKVTSIDTPSKLSHQPTIIVGIYSLRGYRTDRPKRVSSVRGGA